MIAPTQQAAPAAKGTQISGVSPTSEEFFNQTFDSNLHRGSRIIVPVDLQIYVNEDPNPQSVYDLTQIFDDEDKLSNLETFVSKNGAKHYNLDQNKEKIKLIKLNH